MKVTSEAIENRQALLTIEMEPAEVEESLDKAYYRLVKKANIPGFRKGKAPREVLERYMGREGLLEDALNELLPEAYTKAVKEQEIEAFAQPQVEIAQTDPVIFKATVPLSPEIELGDYHDVQLAPEIVEITEGDVSAVIDQLRHRQATWEPVERSVEFTDLVVLDVESTIEDSPFINQKAVQYQVVRDQLSPAPGFAEQLSGMGKDEEKEFTLQFPADYPRDELAGKEASFRVKITEIKQEKLPELDEEFAKGVNPDCKTLDSLREQVSADLKVSAEEKSRMDFEERVIEAVAELAKLEFPPVLVEMQIDRLIDEQARRLQMSGRGLEEYLGIINKTEEELRGELRPLATRRVSHSLVLGKVADEEKIEVGDSEIDAEIENMTKDANDRKEELRTLLSSPQSKESVKQLLITQKTIQRLVEIAQGSNKEVKTIQKEGKNE